MSDSEDDSQDDSALPSREECESRCQKFAEVTGTDTALAMFYLQDVEWNVDTALNKFYEAHSEQETANLKRKIKSDEEDVEYCKQSRKEEIDPEPHRIRLMSWNIDGLDDVAVQRRTKAVCDTINKENPHAVFLQEVTSVTQAILESGCPTYQIIPGGKEEYYTCMLVKVGMVEVIHHQTLPFPNTLMLRNLLLAQCKIKGEDFVLMTSHLESTKDHSKERVAQLQKAFRVMQKSSKSCTVIFGGDLNLRDKEVAGIGGPPPGIKDVWEMTGQRPEAAFTWDMSRNDNKTFPGKFKPKLRFDRLYIRGAESPVIEPVYLELVGLERAPKCGKYPSDHWGLLSHYNIISKVKKLVSKVK
ncbi:tyrosyl-DNA phosphodiesterase 2-like [Ylistrum balloti]|uniref:tyrosyl-DNA phosphodiesterase 2-like n=1 Tax=Ylistrum balloti TaxID=509963 RepID=UPI002905B760|nr:tyrosyl-DNA phosphodiesterase 2-like [Ylistrum balloti]